MAQEDRFSPATKRTIAQRVGFHCSYPGCQVVTIGPNDAASRTSSVGTAAHIAGAEKGAMRYDASMNSAQRSDAANGIWMCENHGKLIDTDEARFTTALLQQWKALAEDIQQLAQEQALSWSDAVAIRRGMKLLRQQVALDKTEAEGQAVGEALIRSALEIAWGREMLLAVRDALAEYAANAHAHGDATEVRLIIEGHAVHLLDDGKPYRHLQLLSEALGRGGQQTMVHLLETFGDEILVTSTREGEHNRLTLALIRKPEDVSDITECVISVAHRDIVSGNVRYQLAETCHEVFVCLESHLMRSATIRLCEQQSDLSRETRPITFIGAHLSGPTMALLKEYFPRARVISLRD